MTTNDMVWNAANTLIYNEGKKEFNAYEVANQVKKMFGVSLSRQDVAIELSNLFKVVRFTPEYTVYGEN